jgi:hypothetical protein
MSDFTPSNRVNSEPRRLRRILPWILLLLLAVAVGADISAQMREIVPSARSVAADSSFCMMPGFAPA